MNLSFENIYTTAPELLARGADMKKVEEKLSDILGNFNELKVDGFYRYHGDEVGFKGYFRINNKGQLLGRTYEGVDEGVDLALHSDYHLIAGELVTSSKLLNFPFIRYIKIPMNPWAVPIYYILIKADSSKKTKGNYHASWMFNPEHLFSSIQGLESLAPPEDAGTAEIKLF